MYADLFATALQETLDRAAPPQPTTARAEYDDVYQLRVDETEARVLEALGEITDHPSFRALYGEASPEVTREDLWTEVRFASPDGGHSLTIGFGVDGDAPDPNHIVLDIDCTQTIAGKSHKVNSDRVVSRGALEDFWCVTPEEAASITVKELGIAVGLAIKTMDPARWQRRLDASEAAAPRPMAP